MNIKMEIELETMIELQALISEREALIAENVYCEFSGESPAYGEKEFVENAQKIRNLLKSEVQK